MNEKRKLSAMTPEEMRAFSDAVSEEMAEMVGHIIEIADGFGLSRDSAMKHVACVLMEATIEWTFENWSDGETEEGEAE